jgi:hypothetical protein
MGPVLSSLVNLQVIELNLRLEKKKLKKIHNSVAYQQQHIEQLKAALNAKHEEIKLTRLHYSKLELELKSQEEEISKYRLALNTAKTNKDYSAVLTQINTKKADKSKLEDQILALMNQIDNDQVACREIEGAIESESEKLVQVVEQSEEKKEAIEADISRLSDKRQELTKDVPAKELAFFERLAQRYDGEVLAEITQVNGRKGDHSCGGCYMTITLESVNALMTKDEVIYCPNCGRILVLDLQPQQQPTNQAK